LSAALLGVLWWGLARLDATFAATHAYYQLRERVGGPLRGAVEEYLHNGDSQRIAAARAGFEALDLQTLPEQVRAPVQGQIDALLSLLSQRANAAGKLAGDPQAL